MGLLLTQLVLGGLGVGLLALPIVMWIRGRRRIHRAMMLPEGLTDDMRVELPPGLTVEQATAFVIDNALRGVPDVETERQMIGSFGLSEADAAHIRERTFGGIYRALMALEGNRLNDPDPVKDPIAFASFQRAVGDPTLVARIGTLAGWGGPGKAGQCAG